MKILIKYLVGYGALLLLESWLSTRHTHIGFLIAGIAFFAFWCYELKRFMRYLEQNHTDVLIEFKRSGMGGMEFLLDFMRAHSEYSDGDDETLVRNCRRVRIARICGFPAFLVLAITGLPR